MSPGPIVVATDVSNHASAAVERALLLARAAGHEVVLVHALDLDVHACWLGVSREPFLVGSVANRVLAEADCDVLVVPSRDGA